MAWITKLVWRCVVATGLAITITELRGDDLAAVLSTLLMMTISLTLLERGFSGDSNIEPYKPPSY